MRRCSARTKHVSGVLAPCTFVDGPEGLSAPPVAAAPRTVATLYADEAHADPLCTVDSLRRDDGVPGHQVTQR